MSYHDGRIHLQNLNPVVHSLQAEFDASAKIPINLKNAILTNGTSATGT